MARFRVLLPCLLAASLAAHPALGLTWVVSADGTGDVPTVAAALGAATPGDVIELLPGTFHETNLVLVDGVTLRSSTGFPEDVILDGDGAGRVLAGAGLNAPTRIEGITITGGRVDPPCFDPATGTYCLGGGLLLVDSSVALVRCVFRANHAHDNGGGLTSVLSAPVLTECLFEANTATHGAAITFVSSERNGEAPQLDRCAFVANQATADAGAVYAYESAPLLVRCTFRGNTCGQQGSAMFWYVSVPPVIERTLITDGTGETPVFSGIAGVVPTLLCCDVWGNAGGDWVGSLAGQSNVNGNFSADPRFCGPDDVSIDVDSPCASGACATVGAGEAVCAATDSRETTRASTWGTLKSGFRR